MSVRRPLPFPHRVTLLPARFAADGPKLPELVTALLLEQLVRHPILSISAAAEDHGGRREEVVWLEVDALGGVRIAARRDGAPPESFEGRGANLSARIEAALHAWLSARHLPTTIRVFPVFDDTELRKTAARVDEIEHTGGGGNHGWEPPVAALAIPFWRAMQPLFDAVPARELDDRILALEPENVISLARIGAPVRPLLDAAPQWGEPHLLADGGDFSMAESLRHQELAALLLPGDPRALESAAAALVRAGRADEGHRWARRALRVAPKRTRAHAEAVRALRRTHRIGAAYAEAQDLGAGKDTVAQLLRAAAMREVGRLDDAIMIARAALASADPPAEDDPELAPWVADVGSWDDDPDEVIVAFAREASFRRDPGRVISGFRRIAPRSAIETAMLIDALIAVGKEDLALIAYAHHEGSGRTDGPSAWLAGAKAMIVAGDVRRAAEHVQRVQLAAPQAQLSSAVHRVLRVGACQPIATWEAAIDERTRAGAKRLARLLARDVADFMPGAGEIASRALGMGESHDYDRAWLDPLRDALAPAALGELSAFFDEARPATLKAADELAALWLDHAPQDAAHLCWAFAQALCRYFALTTRAPNPLAGGFRQVASDALDLLLAHPLELPVARALLEALDAAGRGVDPWVFDTWLVRVERTLGLEDATGARLAKLAGGLRLVGESLRGDERIGFELRLAEDLKDDGDPQNDDAARALYERSFRAVGTALVAAGWSEAAELCLKDEAAVDVHATAAIASGLPAVWMRLGRRLLALGRASSAEELGAPFEALVRARPRPDKLPPNLELGVPIDWARAQQEGLAHLAAGRAAEALRCFRWCDALDPENDVMLKNLGLTYGRLGRVYDAAVMFATIDDEAGPRLAGHALLHAEREAEAVLALRYASQSFTTAEEWMALGAAAWYLEDDETAAEAYEEVAARKAAAGGGLIPAELASFATALYNAGLFERCAEVAAQLITAAGNDVTFRAAGKHAMARALLGQGLIADALPYAQDALRDNPLADNVNELAETLSRVQRGEPYPVRPRRADAASARAWRAVESGDPAAASSIVARAKPGTPDWKLLRAGFAASAFRLDPDAKVAAAALAQLPNVLARTAGRTDLDATLGRIAALAVREAAHSPIDPPPPLGERLTQNELEQKWKDRLEESEPTIMTEVLIATRKTPPAPPPPSAGDPELFPGTKIPRLSDWIRVQKALRGNEDPFSELARLGIEMAVYAQLATSWKEKLADDPSLSARFGREMES